MNARITLSLCLLLTTVPLGGAHMTNPNGSLSSGLLTGDNCRYEGSYAYNDTVFDGVISPENKGDVCPSNSGVSGTYVGSAVVKAGGDAFPLSVSPLVSIFPDGFGSTGYILCDMEVMSFGGAVNDFLGEDPKEDPTDSLLDETMVDNADASQGAGTFTPDGAFDDGGLGGACHTDSWSNDNFNTPGCSGTSHAEDSASGPNVWIGAGCDFYGQMHTAFGDCLNGLFLGGGYVVDSCIAAVTCEIPPYCTPPTFFSCFADGTIDELNTGLGGGDRQPANGGNTGPLHSLHGLFDNKKGPDLGVPYPTNTVNDCPEDTAVASTHVFQGVETNLGTIAHNALHLASETVFPGAEVVEESDGRHSYPNVKYILAMGGWIDWSSDEGNPGEAEFGIEANTCRVPIDQGGFATLGDMVDFVSDTLLEGDDGDVFACSASGVEYLDYCAIEVLGNESAPFDVGEDLYTVVSLVGGSMPCWQEPYT